MLNRFQHAGDHNSKISNYQFWQEGNQPKELFSIAFTKQKLDYTAYYVA
jgi:hypothetical protein